MDYQGEGEIGRKMARQVGRKVDMNKKAEHGVGKGLGYRDFGQKKIEEEVVGKSLCSPKSKGMDWVP